MADNGFGWAVPLSFLQTSAPVDAWNPRHHCDGDNLVGGGDCQDQATLSGSGKFLLLLPELPKWSFTSLQLLRTLHELSNGKGTTVGAGRTGLGHHMHKATLDSHWICYNQKGGWPILCEHQDCQHTRSSSPGYKAHKPGTIIINLLKFLAFLFWLLKSDCFNS